MDGWLMFGTGLGVKLKRWLGDDAAPTPQAMPRPSPPGPLSPEKTIEPPSPYLKTDLDLETLAETAATRFERLIYAHEGKRVMKWSQYLPIYDQVLSPFVGRPATLVEIGLAAGGSLQLWREFLGPQVRIIGVDIEPGAMHHAGPGVEIMIGDQGDPAFLQRIVEQAGPIDILIDDGSHQVDHQILTLETLFPHVRTGGVFVCEDLHTSYWEQFGGGHGRPGTFIEYLKDLLDRMHGRYYGRPAEAGDLVHSVGSLLLADSIAVLHKAQPAETHIVRVGGS